MFGAGDYLIGIGRYFDRVRGSDRVASDTSGLTFEEWTPPDGGGFVINELRSVNFTMTPTTPPPPQLEQVRRSGRRAAVVSAPPPPKPPTEFTMARAVDDDIRSNCW